MSTPSLKFLKQTSLSVDRFSDNGVEKNLHYVIKNNEFSIVVELPNTINNIKHSSFNQLSVEAQLMYDCSPKPKEVLQVRQKPYKYKGIIDRDDPRKCTLQVSISILSSQHEDMNFLLKILVKDSIANNIIAIGFSEPVQVISKPDVLRKKREPKKKKRTWNDRITETLERIEAKQNDAIRLIQASSSSENCTQTDFDNLFHVNQSNIQHPSEAFEVAFYSLVGAYNRMSSEERPKKIRKLIDGYQFDSSVNELISNFNDSKNLPNSSDIKQNVPNENNSPKNTSSPVTVFDHDFDIDGLVEDLFHTVTN